MATVALHPQPPPEPAHPSLDSTVPIPATSSVIEEVRAAHQNLRSRLAGALTSPPPDIDPSLLPTVPLIDLAPSFTDPSSRAAVAAQIRAACLTTGFFQISNHGVSDKAQAGILEQARRYFHELSPAQKDAMHIRHSDYFRGYEPADSSYTGDDLDVNAETTINSLPETKEGFNWGYEPSLDPTGGDGHYVELDGSVPPPGPGYNVWPSEDDLPGFRAGIAEYYAQVLALARHLFGLFASSLGLPDTYFDPVTTHPGGIGRLIYYPPGKPAVTEESDEQAAAAAASAQLGLGAHTDYECFTLLLSSTNPGLEILFPPSPLTHDKPIWLPCPVRPGTLTVNVADFFMRWTGGLYKSTVHRVVTKAGGGERYSVPFFFSINYDADVDELPVDMELIGGDDQAELVRKKYRPMKAGQYVLERLRATRAIEEEEEKGLGRM